MSIAGPIPLNDFVVTAMIADVSTAGQIYVTSPVTGRIVKAYSALNGAITVADAALALKIGGTAVTGGTIAIPYDGSAAGDVGECTPTAANTVNAGQAIEIETDGASTGAVSVVVTLVIRQ